MDTDERLSTDRITPDLVEYVVQKIVRVIQPEKIILFGSCAKGAAGRASDLDLLIVKDDARESSRMIRRRVDSLLRGRRFAVDLLVRSSAEVQWNFRAQNPFYLHHIFRDGKVLHEKP